MLKPEQVPDEVWKLVQLCTGMSEAAARGLAAGVINTWPGSYSLAENDSADIRDVAVIILPLTEASDE